MKKIFIFVLALTLCLTFVGCSGGEPTSRTVWSYEELTYKVTESGSNTEGTLVMIAEKLQNDKTVKMPVITDGAMTEVDVALTSDCHVLKGSLVFGDDCMEYVTVTTSGFRPLYSYKALIRGQEQTAYTGEGEAPACLSYIMTTVYNKTESKATSTYARRRTYSSENWDSTFSSDHWVTYTKEYDNISRPYCDVNQLYYSLRALNDITNKDFTYTLHVPMVLELTTKNLYTRSTPNVSVSSSSIPYISEKYGNDYGLFLTKVTITPQDSPVIGKSIEIYYAESGISSIEDFANATSGSKVTHDKVPVLIRENIESEGDANLNGRGTITYSLVSFSTERD